MRALFAIVLASVGVSACVSVPDRPNFGARDAGSDGKQLELDGAVPPASTLMASCATLVGRTIVNENGNLAIIFTEPLPSATLLGSIAFDFPEGFTGSIPSPEGYNPDDPTSRKIINLTSASSEAFGNHCWSTATPPAGTATIDVYDSAAGIVRATFDNFPVHSCKTDATAICTVTGSIETFGQGVFD